MSKLVILTVELDEAEAVRSYFLRLPVPTPAHFSTEVKRIFSFNAKLHRAIEHTKGVKRRV